MKHSYISLIMSFILMLSFAASCTSSDEIDLPTDPEEEEQSSGDEDTEDDNEEEEEKEEEVDEDEGKEILNFSELIQSEDYQGLTTVEQITKAISQISEGGIIQFEEDETYTITSDLSITKSVRLQGVGVTPTPDSSTATSIADLAGAGEIKTTFKLISSSASLIVKADDVEFRHLRIEGGGTGSGSGNVVEFNGIIRNFKTKNVHFWGGGYHLSPRNYMSPALKCEYTTFEDFHNRGFFINRIYEEYEGANYTVLEKCEFYRCWFEVYDPTTSDTRAISLDAGNTENPNIMDFDGLEIKECYFYDIGIASSKCQNFKVIDCEFYVKDLFDFPLHLEEYSREITISGCLFDCDNSAEIMIGVIDDSVVENNTVTGNCYGFIQGRYAENMVIRNNDLSQMTNTNSSNAISFWDAVGSRNISVYGNKFDAGGVTYIKSTAESESSISYYSNTGGSLNISSTSGYSYPLEDGALCRIKNVDTGLYISAQGSDSETRATSSTGEESEWKVTRIWPNRYNVYNEKYDTYLYIEKCTEGYSTAALADAADIRLKTKYYNTDLGERLPIWDFTKQSSGIYPTYSIVGPGGGNDGCVGVVSTDILRVQKYTTDGNRRSTNTVSDTYCLYELEVIE